MGIRAAADVCKWTQSTLAVSDLSVDVDVGVEKLTNMELNFNAWRAWQGSENQAAMIRASNYADNLWTAQEPAFNRYYDAELAEWVRQTLHSSDVSSLIAYSSPMAQYALGCDFLIASERAVRFSFRPPRLCLTIALAELSSRR